MKMGRTPPVSSSDRAAIAIFVLLPVALFLIPALIGQPLVPGDDFTQNYPLRVLSGHLLAHGQLPLWNANNWSGTALLGGFNAGALFPGTWLFAVVSPVIAWLANEVVTYVVCGLGLYALLRKQGLVSLAAGLASLSFTFAGFMAAHLRHIGLAQGTSLIPCLLLALEGLTAVGMRRAWWWLLLCASGGLIVLSGEPRAISNAAIAAAIYVIALVWRSPDRRRILLGALVATPMIVALGAVQLLPGLAFVHTSQRGSIGYSFFAHGSLPPELLALMLVPYLIGAYNAFHWLPAYVGSYNLPEVVGYIGLLPIVALVTLPWWRPRTGSVRLWAWLVMIVAGLVLAFGGHTPLGHLLADLPLYGGQRLQSRNMCLVDLGLAGVFGWWVNSVLARRHAALPREPRRARGGLVPLVVSLVPSLSVVALITTAWLAAPSLQRFLMVSKVQPGLFGDLLPYLLGTVALAGGIALFAAFHRRLPATVLAACLVLITVTDLGILTINQDPGFAETNALRAGYPGIAQITDALRAGQRIAVYDPKGRDASTFGNELTSDLNAVQGLPTVQGYSSVVDARYDTATGAHTRRLVKPSALAGDIADQLNLRLVLVPPSYLPASATEQRNAGGSVDDALTAALTSPHWVRAGRYGPYLAFANSRVLGRAWVVHPDSRSATERRVPGARVRRTTISDGDVETDVVRSPSRAVLVRSVAYADGWSARLQSSSGESTASVRRLGLVQAVAIPKGVTTVTWRYEPPGLKVGLWLTLLSGGSLTAFGLALIARGIVTRTRRQAGRPN